MYKKIFSIVMSVVLFAGAFAFIPQMTALAATDVVASVEDVTNLEDGFFTAICKYRIIVDGNRRATVKIRQKARWLSGYGVKMHWAYESYRHDYWPNDGYYIGGPYNTNWGSFPTGWDTIQATYAEYTYVGRWAFGSALFYDSPGEFNCVAIDIG